MHGLALLLAAASVGVDYGWQPTADGTMEYIIQIEPELLAALQKGEAIISEIHPDATGVRRFRIQIGSEPLPRISKPSSPVPPLSQEVAPLENPSPESPAGRDSTFTLDKVPPPAPEVAAPSEFPLLPQPDETRFPLGDTPAPSDSRESSFLLPSNKQTNAGSAAPERPLPKPTSGNKTTPEVKKPVPVPDPDRLPLEPAPLPLADQATPAPSMSGSEPDISSPRLATFHQEADSQRPRENVKTKPGADLIIPAARPWLLFSLTILGLLASLGANAYLAYLFIGLQRRYQGLRREGQT